MSFDLGDIDNDGQAELFATDMKPYQRDPHTLASWLPMMSKMPHTTFRGDPQVMENVLQVSDQAGRFHNQAYARSLDASGWSWSGKFGDLDNDGFLDIYVVNGMLAADLFSYLEGTELVEHNQVFRNDGQGYFRRATEWGLGSTASGRGMSMADLDDDGDLDIVVNNLERPAELFENRLCGGTSLQVDLFWPQSRNPRAIGAQLILRAGERSYYRDVRSASGYLSGDPARIHFGLPSDAIPDRLEVQWPDGEVSLIEQPTVGSLLMIRR
jgi:enediyne biosynthesis protein E4